MASKIWSDEELKVLAERVRVLRKTLGLKQTGLAEKLGVSGTSICKVERGTMRVSQKLVYRIDSTYGIDIAEDLDNDDWAPAGNLSVKMDWSALKREERDMLPPITRRIFELMEERNITQKELADSIGIKRASVSSWKQQKSIPYADKIMPICRVLNVTPYYLLEGEDE